MKNKFLLKSLSFLLSICCISSAIPVPIMAQKAIDIVTSEDNMEEISVSENDVSTMEEDTEGEFAFMQKPDLFALSPADPQDKVDDYLSRSNDYDIAAWLKTLSEEDLTSFMEKNTILSQTLDYYGPDFAEDIGIKNGDHFETGLDYFKKLRKNDSLMASYYAAKTTGYYYINLFGTTSMIRVAEIDTTSDLNNANGMAVTTTISNASNGLTIISGGTRLSYFAGTGDSGATKAATKATDITNGGTALHKDHIVRISFDKPANSVISFSKNNFNISGIANAYIDRAEAQTSDGKHHYCYYSPSGTVNDNKDLYTGNTNISCYLVTDVVYNAGVGYKDNSNSVYNTTYTFEAEALTGTIPCSTGSLSYELSFNDNKLIISGDGCPSARLYNAISSNIDQTKVQSIAITGNIDLSKRNDFFSDMESVTEITGMDKVSTAQATSLSGLFKNCKALTQIDTSNFVTTNVTDMSGMFSGCESLSTIDLDFNTGKVTNFDGFLDGCKNLSSIIFGSKFTMENITKDEAVTDYHSLVTQIYPFTEYKKLTKIEKYGSNEVLLPHISFTSEGEVKNNRLLCNAASDTIYTCYDEIDDKPVTATTVFAVAPEKLHYNLYLPNKQTPSLTGEVYQYQDVTNLNAKDLGYEIVGVFTDQDFTREWEYADFTITGKAFSSSKMQILTLDKMQESEFAKNADGNSYDIEVDSSSVPYIDLYMQTGEATKYQINYCVNLSNVDIDNPNPEIYTIDQKAIVLLDLEYPGYTFDGWFLDSDYQTKVSTLDVSGLGNRTVYGKFSPNAYTISYKNLNDVDNSKNPSTYTSGDGKITLLPLSREGYFFCGFYKDKDLTTQINYLQDVVEDTTLYVKWVPISYTIVFQFPDVIFNPNDNFMSENIIYTIEDKVILPEYKISNYFFDGYFINSDFSPESKIEYIPKGTTGDIVVYAKFIKCEHKNMIITPQKDPTCTSIGFEESFRCDECGYLSTIKKISALGHDYVKTNTMTGDDGIYGVYTCSRCQNIELRFESSISNNDTGSNNNDNKNEQNGQNSQNNQTNQNTETDSNDDADDEDVDDTDTDDEDMSEIDDKKEDFVTTTVEYSKDIVYTVEVNGEGSVSITKIDTKASKLNIPMVAGGKEYKVTEIADNAFAGSKVTKVTIPAGIKTIGKNAFAGCKNLSTVTIKGAKNIGSGAFQGCKKLRSISLGNVEVIGNSAFDKCTSLTKITIPSKVKQIGSRAFYGCKKLRSVTIKTKNLKKVGKKAFTGCAKNLTIKVPKTKKAFYTKLLKKKIPTKTKIK